MKRDKIKQTTKRTLKIVLIIIGVIAIIRIALPFIMLDVLNKNLAAMPGYTGKIKDINLAIIRGAYTVDSLYLNKLDSASGKEAPFFSVDKVDLSVEWNALLHGEVVGEIILERPSLVFTKEKVEPEQVAEDSTDFRELLRDFMPIKINRFEVDNGTLRYEDPAAKPPVDVQLEHLFLLATNLRNSYDSTEELPASIGARADLYEGTLEVDVKLDPLAQNPQFDLSASLEETNLVLLNDFFKAYAKVDVNKGSFGLFTEVAAKEGRFKGYVKPIIKDLDIVGMEDRDDNVFRKLWETMVGAVGNIFENKPEDQVATKIPIEGSIKNPRSNIWETVANILQNAFVSALQPTIDHEISIASVEAPEETEKKNFFQRIFGKKDKQKDQKN